ncbi:aspartate ammonia-lyase [Bifidobacterium dolichotidis]|uniref:Aspartate ammonia-lyase n=1 Tax=Bifidobacterium dolichotidis TaxID=2306976 RepID=A0A430FSH6_9BIFI|nr:aspartate ammonia-lyase [Bifidobacterium dolichotidis]RSX55842.1 aspartate ammonia-lyase [Bifidobacterium dolichotidis]
MAQASSNLNTDESLGQATRIEHDCLGELEVPADVYWGIHTQRAITNFTVSGIHESDHVGLVHSYAIVKHACAMANKELGLLDAQKADYICRACERLERGELLDQFPVDVLQGGAGTSMNMNMNEVIANLALELAGRPRGDYGYIHPNDDVNMSQSTNDTFPAACKLAIAMSVKPLKDACERLRESFHSLADKHKDDIKLGRTQLQDAVPMTYGQEFHAFASFLKLDLIAMDELVPKLGSLNLGATAIGTGICADPRFRALAIQHIAELTGLPVSAAYDPIASMTDMSAYIQASATMKNLAVHLKKAADDLRLLNSGPRAGFADLRLPARQAGSSIMPAKVNPVIPECVDQCCFMIFGMDVTVNWACAEGQLQLNAFDPVIIHEILTGMRLEANAMDMFRERCIDGIEVNTEVGRQYAEQSPSLSAALNKSIGYEHAAQIAAQAVSEKRTIREVAKETTDINEHELDQLLDINKLSHTLHQTCQRIGEHR